MADISSAGFNDSENIVYNLFYQIFLPTHVFANPFKEDAKELCDVLVRISDQALVVSVKDKKFDLENDRQIEWARWSRRTITDKVGSLSKAARYLRTYPDKVYLDSTKTKTLPPWAVDIALSKIHKIIIGFNVEAVASDFKYGSEKTLRFQTIEDHTVDDPGMVGIVTSENEEIHIFDIEGLKLLLQYADTPFECLDYFDWRAKRLAKKNIIANGEEDLLTEWMARKGGYWKPGVDIEEMDCDIAELPVVMYQGIHEEFKRSFRYQRKMAASNESGFWDTLAGNIAVAAVRNYNDDAVQLASLSGRLSTEPKMLRAYTWYIFREKCSKYHLFGDAADVIVLSAHDDTFAYYFLLQHDAMTPDQRVTNLAYLTRAVARQLNRCCMGIALTPSAGPTKPVLGYAEPDQDHPVINRDMNEIVITFSDACEWLKERFPAN